MLAFPHVVNVHVLEVVTHKSCLTSASFTVLLFKFTVPLLPTCRTILQTLLERHAFHTYIQTYKDGVLRSEVGE